MTTATPKNSEIVKVRASDVQTRMTGEHFVSCTCSREWSFGEYRAANLGVYPVRHRCACGNTIVIGTYADER